MTADDLFLHAQGLVDRLVRRLRLGAPPPPGRRRLLVVQIDGLSRAMLERALAEGHMPVLRGLLARGGHRLVPMTVGLPTSTPAFQMAVMYGVRPDIPGFHYHDKRRRTDIHFPRAGHAAFVETTQAGDRAGILGGGSVYGCAFTGGAANDFFSFARLTRPRAPGVLRLLTAFVVVGWVATKSAALTGLELVRMLGHLLRRPRRASTAWKWLKKKVGVSVWTRELFTLAVARDLYDGVPAIYVNYLDHDEAAHAFGPESRHALAGLRAVDRSLRQLRRVLRRIPEHRYDLYVLSDHGQAACTPFRELSGGRRFERVFFEEILGIATETVVTALRPAPTRTAELGFEPHLDVREACERAGIRVVSAGPNAFVYFLEFPDPLELSAIEARWPGLPAALSKSPGVGLVLARAPGGPVCFWRGQGHRLDDPDGPFAERDDRAIVLRDLATLMAMPSAGDLVVYGIDAPDGHVSFIDEVGAHGGASPEELHTFVAAPASARFPARVDHPLELYDIFARYQLGGRDGAPRRRARRRAGDTMSS